MIGSTERSLSIEQLESRRLLALNPTAIEQEVLQLVNRFRTDPKGEFNRVFSSASPLRARDASLQAVLDSLPSNRKVNGAMLRNEWNSLSPVEPLVWNKTLQDFAISHNAAMISKNELNHGGTTNFPKSLQQALNEAGISYWLWGENVASGTTTAHLAYAAYAVNWGVNFTTNRSTGGMQDPRVHRENLMKAQYDQIGFSQRTTNASALFGAVNTMVFLDAYNTPIMVTGTVFEDKNGNGWYESGEGRGNVKIDFERTTGEKFTTTTLGAGGYQIALPAGTYKVRATGGGMKHAVVQTITVSDKSLWRNLIYNPTDLAPDSREPNDTRATATQLTGQSPSINNLSLHRDNDVDFFRYVPVGTGLATYEVNFSHAQGNVDIELQDASGNVLARSTGNGNREMISHQADAGNVYFLRVFGKANPKYDLKITGPEAISPDSQEPNDTRQTATVLTGHSPTLSNLSLHSNRDVDYFKYVAVGNGPATFDVEFTHAQGNIDMQLLDATGKVLATSAGNGNGESIARNVQRDTTYYVKVYGEPNRRYSLKVIGPNLRPPVAVDDRAFASSNNSSIAINILSNDLNPDGTRSELIPALAANAPTEFRLNANRTVAYQVTNGYTGMHSTTYTVTNADGLTSAPAKIEVFVVDYTREAPWQNPGRGTDVNDDGRVSALDTLQIINELNSGRARDLPRSGTQSIMGFIDVNGDGRLSAVDALLVINALNSRGQGEGEGESENSSFMADLANQANWNSLVSPNSLGSTNSDSSVVLRDLALARMMPADFLTDHLWLDGDPRKRR